MVGVEIPPRIGQREGAEALSIPSPSSLIHAVKIEGWFYHLPEKRIEGGRKGREGGEKKGRAAAVFPLKNPSSFL